MLPVLTLLDVLHAILDAPQPRTHTTGFVFEWTTAAVLTQNFAVIRRNGGNLRTALAAQPFSTLLSGLEFRPVHMRAPFPSRYPLWAAFAERITNGTEFPSATFPTTIA